jgi:nucleoside-diphosphate-sugar epimerase
MTSSMRIMVTGATGFIGGRIAERLASTAEHEIVAPVRKPPAAGSLPGRVVVRTGDINDAAFASEATDGVEAVIHCAGLTGDYGPYDAYFEANVRLTETLLAAAKARGVRRFVNLSSPSIYFDFRDQYDLTEGTLPRRFSNHYARTKYEGERRVAAAHAPDLLTVSLRPRFVVGAGDRHILPRLIRLQDAGRLFQIGDGKNVIDVTSAANLVDVVDTCLTAPAEAMGETYNITNGAPVVFWQFVDRILTALGRPTRRRRVPRALAMAFARANEWASIALRRDEAPLVLPIPVAVLSQSMTLSIEKARARLGYRPRQSTDEAVQEFVDWWRAAPR